MKAVSRTTITSNNLEQTRIDDLLRSSDRLAKLSIASQGLSQYSLSLNQSTLESQEIGNTENASSVLPFVTQDEETNYCTPQDQAILHKSSCKRYWNF